MDPQIPYENPSTQHTHKTAYLVGGFAIVLVLILLVGVFAFGAKKGSSPSGARQQKNDVVAQSSPDNTIVYGYWTDKNSIIDAYNIKYQKNILLGTLPLNIKHVEVLSPQELFYINDTDERDYGDAIVLYDLSTQKKETVFNAESGYRIDDYVVSPNKKFLAIWEVKPQRISGQFSGSESRVVSYNIDTTQSNLLYDETSSFSTPVDYPVAITDTGDVFTDKFLPNSGAGWGHGMSFTNFDGSTKNQIPSMQSGTYSTQPVLSPDGTQLVFAGYDGSKGDGTQYTDGTRKAIIFPNRIEVLNTKTLTRKVLLQSKGSDLFMAPSWDTSNGILYGIVSKDTARAGQYRYDIPSVTSSRISRDASDGLVHTIITSLSNGQTLMSSEIPSASTVGNLGEKYNPLISNLYILSNNGRTLPISLQNSYVQIIGIEPDDYFADTDIKNLTGGSSNNQLQLQTFALKPTLAPRRQHQQNDKPQVTPIVYTPVPGIDPGSMSCYMYAMKECAQILGLNILDTHNWLEISSSICRQEIESEAWGTCAGSPLYLYGEPGEKVNVSVGTPILSPNTDYDPEKGFDITLSQEGFIANGVFVKDLSFNYQAAIKTKKPSKGVVVTKNAFFETMQNFGKKLGLLPAEIQGVTSQIQLTKPYVFVSFYDDATSKKILPLFFSPKPNTYRNIVFYIEELDAKPSTNYHAPVFTPVKRNGFTAVEVSVIHK